MLKEAGEKGTLFVCAEKITEEDWLKTPESVKRLVRLLMDSFENRVAELEEESGYLPHKKKRAVR